ncbi:hypothetical protein B0H12DRAFT_1075722 [Mycena haematopus]|nr:hypothetical protein B0H12DRAFT_1075722 [Mycena haematopus]
MNGAVEVQVWDDCGRRWERSQGVVGAGGGSVEDTPTLNPDRGDTEESECWMCAPPNRLAGTAADAPLSHDGAQALSKRAFTSLPAARNSVTTSRTSRTHAPRVRCPVARSVCARADADAACAHTPTDTVNALRLRCTSVTPNATPPLLSSSSSPLLSPPQPLAHLCPTNRRRTRGGGSGADIDVVSMAEDFKRPQSIARMGSRLPLAVAATLPVIVYLLDRAPSCRHPPPAPHPAWSLAASVLVLVRTGRCSSMGRGMRRKVQRRRKMLRKGACMPHRPYLPASHGHPQRHAAPLVDAHTQHIVRRLSITSPALMTRLASEQPTNNCMEAMRTPHFHLYPHSAVGISDEYCDNPRRDDTNTYGDSGRESAAPWAIYLLETGGWKTFES